MFDVFAYLKKNPDIYIAFSPSSGNSVFVSVSDSSGRYSTVREVTAATAQASIDRMIAEIGRKKATHYGNSHVARQLRERELFFREGEA